MQQNTSEHWAQPTPIQSRMNQLTKRECDIDIAAAIISEIGILDMFVRVYFRTRRSVQDRGLEPCWPIVRSSTAEPAAISDHFDEPLRKRPATLKDTEICQSNETLPTDIYVAFTVGRVIYAPSC